jgi:hypothetical protein
LKRNPMHPDRETERADRCDPPKTPKHAVETSVPTVRTSIHRHFR